MKLEDGTACRALVFCVNDATEVKAKLYDVMLLGSEKESTVEEAQTSLAWFLVKGELFGEQQHSPRRAFLIK